MILAGDIGGTKTNIGLFDGQGGKLTRVAHKRYASREHSGLLEVLQDFLREHPAKLTASAYGIAGPIVNNTVHATNLPWIIDGNSIAKYLGLEQVRLLNDLQSAAYGISVLGSEDFETLNDGIPAPEANRAVIAAGTGLGEAILFWAGKRHVAVATEAGHADFAPSTNQQADLWKFLKVRNEYVSVETILNGDGFQRVHEFLGPDVKHPEFDQPDGAAAPAITRMGLSGECPVCAATVDMWVEIYGSEAGNMAVRSLARGGIFVTGGIAIKILPKMKDGRFITALRHKGKMGDFLAQIPVRVVLNEDCPLIGAAYAAQNGL